MEETKATEQGPALSEPVPKGQQIFDNWVLLLILSLLISGVLYNVWGLIETLSSPALVP